MSTTGLFLASVAGIKQSDGTGMASRGELSRRVPRRERLYWAEKTRPPELDEVRLRPAAVRSKRLRLAVQQAQR
jgi:hypothetical protein